MIIRLTREHTFVNLLGWKENFPIKIIDSSESVMYKISGCWWLLNLLINDSMIIVNKSMQPFTKNEPSSYIKMKYFKVKQTTQ